MIALPTPQIVLDQMAATATGRAELRRLLEQGEKLLVATDAKQKVERDSHEAARAKHVLKLDQIRAALGAVRA